MKSGRRNAFALSKQGDVQPETPSSPDDAQEGVFDRVSSSQGVDLRSDTEDDDSRSSSSVHLTEVQVQGIKITFPGLHDFIFPCVFVYKNTVNERARICCCI